MNKLSRTKRYQDLRNQLDEETTLVHADDVKVMSSRNENGNLSHANQPLHPHQEEPKFSDIEFQASPVMDELLGEVKQYNIDNGSRFDNDTQINILRQLESSSDSKRKNVHFIDMDDFAEPSGNTVKLPKSVNQDLEVASFMNRAEGEINSEKFSDDKVVLNSDNVQAEPVHVEEKELEEVFEKELKPRKTKKLKKAKKKKEKKEYKEELEDMPSAKMRMIADNYEEVHEGNKSGKVINVVIFILVMLLLATIGTAFFMLKESGVL